MAPRRKSAPDTTALGRPRAGSDGLGYDVVVIGASAGGVEALLKLVATLPPAMPAAIFIVLHLPPSPTSRLPQLLTRAGPLPACYPLHGQAIEPGRIYIAPPDMHMTLDATGIRVLRGPMENGHRPAVDPLFRTAARFFRERVIGVVLTGALDCGTAGLQAVQAFGGMTVVQDPEDAFCADMPRSALRHLHADHVLPLAEIPALLAQLVAMTPTPARAVRDLDAEIVDKSLPTSIVCPSCGGAMTESEVGGLLQFRCHVGHAFSLEGMASEQAHALEAALWAATRALQESEDLARRMALRAGGDMAQRFIAKAESMRQHSQQIERILLGGGLLTPDESALVTVNGGGVGLDPGDGNAHSNTEAYGNGKPKSSGTLRNHDKRNGRAGVARAVDAPSPRASGKRANKAAHPRTRTRQ